MFVIIGYDNVNLLKFPTVPQSIGEFKIKYSQCHIYAFLIRLYDVLNHSRFG